MAPGNGWPRAQGLWWFKAHGIALALRSYANDNDLRLPGSANSTEIFQKLVEGGYVIDNQVFYIPLPGKIKPVIGQKLKPENVCFDMTTGVDFREVPEGLPIVFMTGYKVTYIAGSSAVPIIKPYPNFGAEFPTWWAWWHSIPQEPGIVSADINSNSKFLKLETGANGERFIPNFIPPGFDTKGKTYCQLTPDGPLLSN